eukprot:m.244505 g.244505  ORF g.244505 m.244505 type:complete len:404 (-) comp31398_c0_seq1:23-1234(-)
MVSIHRKVPASVFNLCLYDSYLVLDVRPAEHHAVARVPTSVCCGVFAPTLSGPHEEIEVEPAVLLQRLYQLIDEHTPEHFSPIVFVHDRTEASREMATLLATHLRTAILSFKQASTSGGAHSNSGESDTTTAASAHVVGFPERVRQCDELWLLDFDDFYAQFPRVCEQDVRPTPRCIAPRVYVSSRKVYAHTITDLGITDVITDAPFELHEEQGPYVAAATPHQGAGRGRQASASLSRPHHHAATFTAVYCQRLPGYHAPHGDEPPFALWTVAAAEMWTVVREGGCVLLHMPSHATALACAAAYLCLTGLTLADALGQVRTALRVTRMPLHESLPIMAWAQHELPTLVARLPGAANNALASHTPWTDPNTPWGTLTRPDRPASRATVKASTARSKSAAPLEDW